MLFNHMDYLGCNNNYLQILNFLMTHLTGKHLQQKMMLKLTILQKSFSNTLMKQTKIQKFSHFVQNRKKNEISFFTDNLERTMPRGWRPIENDLWLDRQRGLHLSLKDLKISLSKHGMDITHLKRVMKLERKSWKNMNLIKYPDLWANDETEIWTNSPQPMNTSVIETTFEDVRKQKKRNFVSFCENMNQNCLLGYKTTTLKEFHILHN